MSSRQDVKVKDVDAIHAYDGKFGDFFEVMTHDLGRLRDALLSARDKVERQYKEARSQYEQSQADVRSARDEWYDCNRREHDPKEVSRLRQQLDHAEWRSHSMQTQTSFAQSYCAQAKRDIGQMLEMTEKYGLRLADKVEKGHGFLTRAEADIRQYKDSKGGV